jgi:hypothetical protein
MVMELQRSQVQLFSMSGFQHLRSELSQVHLMQL